MDYQELKGALAAGNQVPGENFDLLRDIARHVNNAATTHEGRDLVIRALAVGGGFSQPEMSLLMALVRNVGLYPYLTESIARADFADQLAFELHRPDSDDSNIVFHTLQARTYRQLMLGSNVVLSASTSSGKSLVIDEMIASGKFRKAVIVVPTLALIDETRRRLLRRFGERCAVITHPSQQAKPERINVYVLTQERVLNREDLDDVDFFVVDEFYKMNLSTEKDSERAVDLNLAFHKLAKTGAQFYLLGPNIHEIKGLDAYDHHFIPSKFSTVAIDVINFDLPSRGTERDDGLVDLCRTIDGPTIIYCQSPARATHVAKLLIERGDLKPIGEVDHAIEWIAKHYDPDWIVCDALHRGVGIHHGGIPRALQQYFIRLFNARKIPFLVCTSTIIEGVNTAAKNVIVYDRRKSRDVLEHFTYKNIEGRAGRMKQYFVGKVYVLEAPPPDKSFTVEFPLGTQDADTPMSLLLDLSDEDLELISKSRIERMFKRSTLSPETLRANRHVRWEVQEQIANEIRERIRELAPLLGWTGVPTSHQLNTVCDLIFRYLNPDGLRDYKIRSGEELAWHLNELRIGKDLTRYIRACVEGRIAPETASEAVERALRIVRNVICQRFPRALMVIHAIQHDILTRQKLVPGDYAFFAEQAENLFMPSVLFALDEYGVPIQTAKTLEPWLLPAQTLDDVLERFRSLPLARFQLSAFESDVIADVRQVLFPPARVGRA